MKKLLISILLATGLVSVGYSQSNVVSSPIWDFLTQGSNWVVAPYITYDATDKSLGGGIGAGYKLSEFVVPTLRLDYVKGSLFVPSGSLQLQVPVTFMGKVTVTPFTFSGIATAFDNKHSGEPIGIFGLGGYIKLPKDTKWYVPKYILSDYERWTGGGFNDNQIRFGIGWPL